MDTLYTLYVGSNNDTHVVELDKVYAKLEAHNIDGATIKPTIGYWKGNREDSVAIEVFGDAQLADTMEQLRQELVSILEQEAVILTRVPIALTI